MLRSLWRSKGYAIGLVLILALGIGANTAIFSIVDAVLFRELPLPNVDQLVRVFATDDARREMAQSSYPVYTDYRDQSTAFSGLAAYGDVEPYHLSRDGTRPMRVHGETVTGNYFQVLGVQPARGRLLVPADDRAESAGAPAAVVLSERLWRRAFGADPEVVGSTIRLNHAGFTVVGIAPAEFTGTSVESAPELWVTLGAASTMGELAQFKPLTTRGFHWLFVVGRLRPGVTLAAADAQLNTIAVRRAATQPADQRDPKALITPLDGAANFPEAARERARTSWILLGVVTLVLLIACVDSAGLLLARAERRRREMAIRVALGASRARLARETVAEGVVLSLAGAGIGVLVAWWLSDLIVAMAPPGFAVPLAAATQVLDSRTLLFAAGTALVTGVLFSLAPALRRSDRGLTAVLKGGRPRVSLGGRRRATLRDLLLSVQIALSAVLLVGAGLLLRTLSNQRAVRPGFDPDGAIVASVDLSRQGYDEARAGRFYAQLLDRLRAVPGIRSAAVGYSVPIQPGGVRTSVSVEGYRRAPNESMDIEANTVSAGYFATLGNPVIRGREFTADDVPGRPPVIIVNQAFADRFWPGQDPIGKRVGDVSNPPATVVGVVGNAKLRSLREPPQPATALSLPQFFFRNLTILVRTDLTPEAAARAIEEAVGAVDPEVPVFGVRTLRERLGLAYAQERLLASLLSGFAGLAIVLAAIGLYGIVSYTMQSRTREWGIRLALGARTLDVLRLAQHQSIVVAAFGLAAGLAASYGLSRFVRGMLFGVAPNDPLTYVAVAVVLGVVALIAGFVPARRATRVDPTVALRSE